MRTWKIAPLILALSIGAAGAAAAAEEDHADRQGWIERMCADAGKATPNADRAQRRLDRVADRLKLSDAQKTALKDLWDTRAKLRADRQTALCANKPDLSTFDKRLAFQQTKLENRLADLKIIAPKLSSFYDSLDDAQKQAFDDLGGRAGPHRDGERDHRRHHDDDSDD